MKCAYLALFLLLALAICADAAKKGSKKARPKPGKKKKNVKKGRPQLKPRPPAPRPLPPPPPPPKKPVPPLPPPKCDPEQKVMNKLLQEYLQKDIQDVQGRHHAMYFCGLWRVVELAQDYHFVLQGIKIIKHKFDLQPSQKREKYAYNFERKHYKEIVKYPPLVMGDFAVLPFGCKWEMNRKEVTCLFVTAGFVQYLAELAIPGNPALKDISKGLYRLQNM